MPNKPDPLTLLEATSKSLAERVAPSLTGAARYEVLLAISAIGTVVRELADCGQPRHDEPKQILDLLGRNESAGYDSMDSPEEELATAIREGRFAASDDTASLIDYLKQSCLRNLAVTNPRVADDYRSQADT